MDVFGVREIWTLLGNIKQPCVSFNSYTELTCLIHDARLYSNIEVFYFVGRGKSWVVRPCIIIVLGVFNTER